MFERQPGEPTAPSSTSAADTGSLPAERVMRIAPLDLRQPRFRTVMRGFDKTEVVAFLTEAADDYEHALREIDRLRQDLHRMETALSEHREREDNLRNTLLTAQRLADQVREAAQNEAKLIRTGGERPRRPAPRKGADQAWGARARDHRPPAAPPRCRGFARSLDPVAVPRARVHPRYRQGQRQPPGPSRESGGGSRARPLTRRRSQPGRRAKLTPWCRFARPPRGSPSRSASCRGLGEPRSPGCAAMRCSSGSRRLPWTGRPTRRWSPVSRPWWTVPGATSRSSRVRRHATSGSQSRA